MLLYINWDGFSRHWYEMARRHGDGTPNLDRMIAQGAFLSNHVCGLPAITNPMQQTLVSGAWPVDTGNCYIRFDKVERRFVPTGRTNRCENLAEAARRQGLRCASVHGWYFENRGCTEGDAQAPYIQDNLPNFETRAALLLSYLKGEPVPSGSRSIVMQQRPDFLSLYADDIDSVCHNGGRLPYPELRRARTLDEWYANLVYTVQRMDRALAPLLALEDTTVALAADHGGMPYATKAFGISREEAILPRQRALLQAIESAGVAPFVFTSKEQTIPEDASAVLLSIGTQAFFCALKPMPALIPHIQQAVSALPFIRGCLDAGQQQAYGAPAGFCDLYILTKSPFFLTCEGSVGEFVGGSHAAMDSSVLEVFCALCGTGVRPGVYVTRQTDVTDFAPTLCRLMGIQAPANSTGRVLAEILQQGV